MLWLDKLLGRKIYDMKVHVWLSPTMYQYKRKKVGIYTVQVTENTKAHIIRKRLRKQLNFKLNYGIFGSTSFPVMVNWKEKQSGSSRTTYDDGNPWWYYTRHDEDFEMSFIIISNRLWRQSSEERTWARMYPFAKISNIPVIPIDEWLNKETYDFYLSDGLNPSEYLEEEN